MTVGREAFGLARAVLRWRAAAGEGVLAANAAAGGATAAFARLHAETEGALGKATPHLLGHILWRLDRHRYAWSIMGGRLRRDF